MQIHFAQQFPWGDQTYFIEKIWAGFAQNAFLWLERNGQWSTEPFKEIFPYDYDWFPVFMSVGPKLHTIREDKNDRWKAGKIIHFEQWKGKPYKSKCYHFAPVIPCVSVQTIKIEHFVGVVFKSKVTVYVDGRSLSHAEKEQLAVNDGFKNFEEFCKWFSEDFEGKIIHWTDFKY